MKLKEYAIECLKNGALGGWLCFLTSVTLMVASFVLPPSGIIDPSVLAGVGELFAFAVVFKLPAMVQSIKDGKRVKLSKGDTSIEIHGDKQD